MTQTVTTKARPAARIRRTSCTPHQQPSYHPCRSVQKSNRMFLIYSTKNSWTFIKTFWV